MGYESAEKSWEDLINEIIINGEPFQPITSISSDGNTIKINYDKIKEENKMNCTEYEPVGVRKILKIYKEREYEYIDQEYITAKNEIIEKDKIHAICIEYINKIKEAYEKEWKQEIPFVHSFELYAGENILTQKTEKKLGEIEKERKFNEHNLEEKLEEVEARLEMTNDYDKQIEILKTYEILDEEGRINA